MRFNQFSMKTVEIMKTFQCFMLVTWQSNWIWLVGQCMFRINNACPMFINLNRVRSCHIITKNRISLDTIYLEWQVLGKTHFWVDHWKKMYSNFDQLALQRFVWNTNINHLALKFDIWRTIISKKEVWYV